MKFKIKPLMLSAIIATSTALTGCGGSEPTPEIQNVFEETGLWCKNPEIVQIASADSYALSEAEESALATAKGEAKAQALADAGGTWTAEEEASWEASFKYESLDLYSLLGLTIEETERQAVAKEEARAFQISKGQDIVRGDDFDAWFDSWFAAIPPANYLGASQRINRSVNATTAAMDGQEICYSPPLSCPNYKEIDESGNYDCIIPESNPIEDAPAAEYVAGAGEAVAYYRHEDHVEGADNSALYENIVIHTWNNDDCTAYADDSISPQWGITGADLAGVDDNYGAYWIVNLVDTPSTCANIIFNDTSTGKKISDSDLTMPIGPSGDIALHNIDKNAYAHDDFPVNVLDGLLIINQHPFFGAEASSGLKSCGWGMEADESGEQCLGQALVCPEGYVAVGVAAVDIASKCVAVFDPETTDLYIRGGFNGWGAEESGKLAYVGEGQYRINYTYMTECEITEATEESPAETCTANYDFKVADADWSEASSFGSIKDGDQSSVGATIAMTVGEGIGQNMKVELTKDKIYQFLVNAADPAATELTIKEVPVDAFPMLTIGAETVQLQYTTNGNYVVRMALAAETHSFTIADEASGFAVGAIENDNVVMENTPLSLMNGGGALAFTSSAAEYDFILNLSNPASPMIEIKPALPWGSDQVYIRGSVNGWGVWATDEMLWNGDSRSYSVVYGLEAGGNHAFKFADANWGPVNLGYNEVSVSDEGETVENDGGNMRVSVEKSTSYKFEVSFATADPIVKVSEAPIYLRGGVTGSGWGADAGNQLAFMPSDEGNSAEASHTYSLEVNYPGGGAQFKVADEGWGGTLGYNYGVEVADTAVVLGEPLTLVNSNNNILIDIPAGTYIFAFEDGVTKTMTVTEKE
ncbi:MAG: hypothetical protein P8I03_11155 [Thalassotalea sp.]|nr:hypothetical protein [Thalassotalea sp.]